MSIRRCITDHWGVPVIASAGYFLSPLYAPSAIAIVLYFVAGAISTISMVFWDQDELPPGVPNFWTAIFFWPLVLGVAIWRKRRLARNSVYWDPREGRS